MVKLENENIYLNHTIIIFACYGVISMVKDVMVKYNNYIINKVKVEFDSDSDIIILNDSDSDIENI